MNVRLLALPTLALLLTAQAQGAGAQDAAARMRPRLGVLAGLNLANVGGEDVEEGEPDSRRGLIVGAAAIVPLDATGTVSLYPHLLYSQKGWEESDVDADFEFSVNYVELPVLLRYAFPTAGTWRPFIVAGPAAGYQIGCKIRGTFEGFSLSLDCDDFDEIIGEGVEETFERKKFEFSGVVGAGVDVPVGRQTLTISGRYSHGFTDLFENIDGKNRVWTILVGLGF